MTNKKTAVGIMGAGITGLATAYALQKHDIPVTVYEKNTETGGAIQTYRKDRWLVEEGPNTLRITSREIWDLLKELNLQDDIVEANSRAKRRFIVKDGKPIALPSSLASFLRTPLLSARAKLRLLKEPFISSSQKDDESIASFIRRRIGNEPLDYGINPFISGIYAGDPKKLSIKHTFSSLWEMEQQYGSLLKGMIKKKKSSSSVKKLLISFTEGTQMLPHALAEALAHPVQTSCKIRSAKRKDGKWTITGMRGAESFQAEHEVLISTLPAYRLPSIFESDLFDLLADVPYVPLSVLALGFKSEQITHPLDGFGMLIPKAEHFNLLGGLFSSSLFPARAPKQHHLLTCFIGGARQPELASKSKNDLLELLLPDLRQLLEIKGDPVFIHHKFWKQAIPQYNVGFDRYLSTMDTIEEQFPGLLLQGNFRDGVSVPNCITSGFDTARKAERMLK